ncbi:MAG: sulfite exporter TauE/SafE family protein [Candidatus Eisenbacteria sp.]|nr:sulfite exporter TauE/SafE family protein [Candidatus Eisenbacteria bacterium]
MELWQYPVLIAGGFLCGIINALAGGGSFVTLPLLLLIGLPPQVANATNRVAITLQCVAGTATYHRHGVLLWRHLPAIAIPTVLGSLLGAYLAAHVDESIFRKVAAILFAVMAGTVLIDPKRWARENSVGRIRPRIYPLFFLMGIYGGFLQAGLGVLLISTFVLAGGYDVVRGNALKFALALVFTLAALLMFASMGQVRWSTGLFLAIGTIAGGIVGARLVIVKGSRWVRVFVVIAAIGAIVKLLLGE